MRMSHQPHLPQEQDSEQNKAKKKKRPWAISLSDFLMLEKEKEEKRYGQNPDAEIEVDPKVGRPPNYIRIKHELEEQESVYEEQY